MSACIVSHDAGGAEILASYVAETRLPCRLVLEGPALRVFERRFGVVQIAPLEEALATCTWCLLGTSWQSDLEWRALARARALGKRTVSFIDHWVNYPERFIRGSMQHLPDEIWIGDGDAAALAQKCFPETTVKLVPNPYFRYLRAQFDALSRKGVPRSGEVTVLFVCENLSEHARLRFGDPSHWGYTEFDAIEFLFNHIEALGPVRRVIIRPHPSDPADKYADTLRRHTPIGELGGMRPLVEEIASVDVVAGCESMALVAAVIAGKRAVSCLPPGIRASFVEGREGIEMLRNIRKQNATRVAP